MIFRRLNRQVQRMDSHGAKMYRATQLSSGPSSGISPGPYTPKLTETTSIIITRTWPLGFRGYAPL